jgi:hypothetical protein
MKNLILSLALLLGAQAQAAVTLPYTFSSGSTINASQVNANDQALRDGINAHLVATNPHGVTLATALASGNSCGSTNINFNGTNALNFEVENVTVDPTCNAGATGRLIYNTIDTLFKICNGTSFISIAGTGVNTLASVLSAGNSAGASNLNMNGNQLLSARLENRTSDPSAVAGGMIYRTDTSEMKISNGTTWTALGGAQGLASVLGVSNSTGSTNIDFNGTQGVNFRWEQLASNPGTTTKGRVYYNTTSDKPFYYNGTSWLQVGNTNTLAQTAALGNSMGSTDLDMNLRQILNARVENLGSSPGTGNAGRFWFNTGSNVLQYATGSASKTVCSLDDAQTFTNKTISGSSNTITNIPDSALSANVGLLDATQTFTGAKTFTFAPTVVGLRTSSGGIHTLTNGLANDTITLNNAVQTLAGKTLNAPTLSGDLDFALYQGKNMVLEKLAANPGTPTAGRMFYKTTTGEFLFGTGTEWRVLTSNASTLFTLSGILSNGNSAGAFDIDLNENQLLNARVENLAVDPTSDPLNEGRLFWDTANDVLKADTGTAIKTMADTNSAQTLTNKTLAAGSNTITGLVNANIGAGAAIAQNKMAALTVSRAMATDASGFASASATTAVELGYLSGVTSAVQTQLNTNATNTSTVSTNLAAHIANGTGAHAASAISFSPVGTIASTDTQSAVAEVATDAATALSAHAATTTSVHGIADTAQLATLNTAQTIAAAKTFSAPLVLAYNTTPAAASASTVKVYAKSDDKLYRIDSGGVEREIGGGALLLSGTRGSPNSITAAGGITATTNQRQLMFVQGNAAPITVTASPAISAGTITGQELILVGRSDTNTLTINTGTGVELNGPATLGASDVLTLIWDGTSWIEQSRNF